MKFSFASRVSKMPPFSVRPDRRAQRHESWISLAEELPAEELFPLAQLGEAAGAVFSAGPLALQYGDVAGSLALRQWLHSRWQKDQQLIVDPANMLLTSGSQQTIDLLVRIYVNHGDVVLIESPAPPGCLQVLHLQGAYVVHVDCDHDGMKPDELERLIAQHQPKLLFVSPNFGNPTGRAWTLERRKAVLALCRQHELLIAEDDAYGDLHFGAEPVRSFRRRYPSLFQLDRELGGNHVLYIGSFSKTIVPALRIGWAAGDPQLIEVLSAAKQTADWQSSTMNQAILLRLLQSPRFDWDSHITMLNREYDIRLKLMLELLKRPNWRGTETEVPVGGMFLWARLPDELDGEQLLQRALAKGVSFLPGKRCYADGQGSSHIRLNFTHPGREELLLGMNLISEAIAEMRS
ncbi:PLP-dependent aminotransferase family protein [Paenibacillus campi]|uniref:aminotransferase-like domain-containing protein n=1 Tax=Paenibacillus campi TaxID=3106031 RepID=UPI002AFF1089|nr:MULTISPECIES: PLP-dependent aminotransferase family protein [unclassified Paenibacillus]